MTKIREYLKDRTLKRYVVFIAVTAFLLFALYFIFKNLDVIAGGAQKGISSILNTLAPLFIGMFIAYLLNPLVTLAYQRLFFKAFPNLDDPKKDAKRQKRNRLFSVLLAYLFVIACVVAIIYGFVAMVGGQLVTDSLPKVMDSFSKTLLSYEETLKTWVKEIPSGMVSERLQDFINSFIKWISQSLSSGSLVSTLKSVGGSIVNIAIGLVVSIYLSYDKELFLGVWNRFLSLVFPQRISLTINSNLNDINGVLSQFLRGVLLDALIVAILSSIGFTIIGLKFAVFLGIFAGIFNVIPYFGPIIGTVPAFLVGILTGGVKEGLLAILVLIIVQQIDANLIYPRVVGSSTGLHPLFVLLAVTIGGAYGGLVGMIIAVPIAGIVQLYVQKWVKRRESKLELADASKESKGAEEEKQEEALPKEPL